MKKLIIAAAIVCSAVLTQAANVTWGLSGVKDPVKTTENLASGYAYLFMVTDSITVDKVVDSINDGTFATAMAANATKEKAIASGALTYMNAVTGISGDITYFTVYFDSSTGFSGAKNYGVTAPSTQTLPSGGAMKPYNFTANGWTTIAPEPTSGLLMLLGMAGLALRRRRA